MYIESMTLTDFRCFGPEPTHVALASGLSAVVGSNASGKTALLHGLRRLFGITRAERTIQLSDFHAGRDAAASVVKTKSLSIDVRIELPELVKGTATARTVAPIFRHMRIARAGAVPVCRIRLEARWDDDGTAEGQVTQQTYWVDTLDETITDEQRHPIAPADRGLIQLYYTPASRDATAQIKATTGALAARLLKAIEWSTATQDAVDSTTKKLSAAFGAESAIKAIAEALGTRWTDLHDEIVDTCPSLTLISRRFEDVIAQISVVFKQGPAELERGLEALSDGQQSLFYFALAAAVFDLERRAVAGKVKGFRTEGLVIPALTIFAIEEPENHLSPYYLARIVRQIRSLVEAGASQALITSHSPSVLSRVEPTEVRYCRLDSSTGRSSVRAVALPKDDVEAIKFVRSAMLAFPELYFARFVLLVEGDSERVVLPKLAEALGLLVDPAFVAIVPLGGRHVQHFWRLLSGLGIPYATLLDLDYGRDGGAYGRVKIAIQRLLEVGTERSKVLTLSDDTVMDDERLSKMHTWPLDTKNLRGWLNYVEKSGVFFAWPLDLDLAMLAAFPNAYKATIDGTGPRMTNEDAAPVVLGAGGSGITAYTDELDDFANQMAAYRYHFLTHSKPATHLRALTHLTDEDIQKGLPAVLKRVLMHVQSNLPSIL